MKLTEPPWATVSIRVSLSAAMTAGVARMATISSISFLAPGDDDQVEAGCTGFIREGSVDWRAKAEAIAGFQIVAGAGFVDDQFALEHPDHLADAGVRDGRHAHSRPGGQLDAHQLDRVIDALYRDPRLMEKSGMVLVGAELAQQYGIRDIDGRQPPSHRAMLGGPVQAHPAKVE